MEVGVPGLLVVKRLKMEGFIVMDFADRDADAERDLATWLADGSLKVIEDTYRHVLPQDEPISASQLWTEPKPSQIG